MNNIEKNIEKWFNKRLKVIQDANKRAEMACKTPGLKIRSKGKGRGLAKGRGRGPLGIPYRW